MKPSSNTHRIYTMQEVIGLYLGKTPNGQSIHEAELKQLSCEALMELAELAADELFLPMKQRAFVGRAVDANAAKAA